MRISFYFFLAVLFVSCSRKYTAVVVHPESEDTYIENNTEYAYIQDTVLDLRLAYVGDAFNYIIFESRIINKTAEDLKLSNDQFVLKVDARNRKIPVRTLMALDPSDEIHYLRDIQRQEETEKKGELIGSILGGVLIGTLISPEAAAIYSVERGISILGHRAESDDIIRSVEDEILYLQTGVLDNYTLPPGDTLEIDLLFSRLEYPGRLTVSADINNQEYEILFGQKIEEYRK